MKEKQEFAERLSDGATRLAERLEDEPREFGDQDEFDEWVRENFDEGDRFFLIPEYRGG